MAIALVLVVALAAGCTGGKTAGSSNGKTVIKIGAQNYTEPIVLAHMLKILIEQDTDLRAETVEGLGATTVLHQAMLNNEVQISAARYVGTDLTGALGVSDPIRDPAQAMQMVQKGFTDKFQQKWYDGYGFENTYAFAVRDDMAASRGYEKVSDLAKDAGSLSLGVDTDWLERPADGYGAFTKEYFKFGKTIPMDIGLVYKALADKKMDVVLAYSTDGRIQSFHLKTLVDDKHFFPPYQASPVARMDILQKYPELDKTIQKLVGKIDTQTMTSLNYEVDEGGKSADEAAREFLQKAGLLK